MFHNELGCSTCLISVHITKAHGQSVLTNKSSIVIKFNCCHGVKWSNRIWVNESYSAPPGVFPCPRWLNKSPNLGNMPHKQGGIAETVRKCNGELGIKLATIVVAVTLVAKQWGKAHWNAGMCQYQHSHWALIRLRGPNALCKSCWMLCILCIRSYREACFQFVPSVRRQSAYFDTFTGIFRKCDSANAFWTK